MDEHPGFETERRVSKVISRLNHFVKRGSCMIPLSELNPERVMFRENVRSELHDPKYFRSEQRGQMDEGVSMQK